MSGELHAPLLAPEQAGKLLEDVLYERVLRCVDLEALFLIEVDVWVALCECKAAQDDVAGKRMAKAMIDRALRRLPDEARRYSLVAPFGAECADCEAELLASTKQARGRKTG